MSQLDKEAFNKFFSKVISPALEKEKESIEKLKQMQKEEEHGELLENVDSDTTQ